MSNWVIHQGDVLERLREMPSESVNCVVTSPPYWGLRDYGHDGQIGLEPTPQEFVGKLAEVFRECRRVLTKDGTCWVNLGDSYTSGGRTWRAPNRNGMRSDANSARVDGRPQTPDGLKAKDLVGIPWRVAFALQDDGWWLRQDIIWAKPNPMPESVRDRCTKAHEYIFMFTKSPQYWYDADALREPHTEVTLQRIKYGLKHKHPENVGVAIPPVDTDVMGERFANPLGRNARSVWTVVTEPYPKAHFAVFPSEIPKRCILAGCPQDGVVLDPFAGSGTTLAVAVSLGRRAIGIELNPEYVALIEERMSGVTPSLFAEAQ